MLVLAVSEDFDKLLENGGLTAIASLGEFGGIVVVAIDVSLVFVVAVLGAKDGWTYGTCKVLNVVFTIQCGDIGSSQGTSASMTEEVEAAEIVSLAKRVLIRGLIGHGEEFGGNHLSAILSRCQ